MRTRTIVTVAILTAGASAGSAAHSADASPTASRSWISTMVAAAAAAVAPPAVAAVAPPVVDEAALEALAVELTDRRGEAPAAGFDRFRPLCDAEGYPLVGNLPRKSSARPVADFCESVRSDLQAAR